MNNHFKKVSLEIKKNYLKNKKKKILEIGCNDGIFLKNFKKYNHLGIEPSKNVYKIAKQNSLNVINNFFNTTSY